MWSRSIEAYKAAVETLGLPYELVYVLSWQSERALADLKSLKQRGERALVLVLGQQLNEPEALLNGFKHARGDIILTLPADLQVEPADIPKVIAALDDLRRRCRAAAAGRRHAAPASRPRPSTGCCGGCSAMPSPTWSAGSERSAGR